MSYTIFGAVWCGNCVTTKQNLDAMGIEYTYVDIDAEHDKAVENNIRSLPTLIDSEGNRAVGLVKIMELVKTNVDLPSN